MSRSDDDDVRFGQAGCDVGGGRGPLVPAEHGELWYLDAEQRTNAVVLSQALFAARTDAVRGADAALGAARAVLRTTPGVDLDYLEVTAPDLGPTPQRGEARMLIAARVGSTRLIDNVPLFLGPSEGDDS